MKNKRLISIVVVNYNGKKYLERSLPSFLNLNYPSKEIIVVDNGSTDGSVEYLSAIEKIKLIKSPRIREKNYACNLGVKEAKGDYIFLVDNDLVIDDAGLLDNLLDMYVSKDNAGIVNIAFKDEGKIFTTGYGNFLSLFPNNKKSVEYSKLKEVNGIKISFPSGIGIFVKKDFWNTLGGYNEKFIFGADDFDIGIRTWLLGKKCYLFSESVHLHIGNDSRKDKNELYFRYKNLILGRLSILFQNLNFKNMLINLITVFIYEFLHALKYTVKLRHYGPIYGYFVALGLFFLNLPDNIKDRRRIQSQRVVKKDIFLNIKSPF